MNQTDYSLLEKMNIQTDAIVINQCDKNEIKEFIWNNHNILWMSLKERGIGLSRNTALSRADGEILLFADDDIVYIDDYEREILEFFDKTKTSVALFNLTSLNKNRPEHIDLRDHRVHRFNCLKYGAFRIAVKHEDIKKENVFFSLMFGGGAKYQAGEDNLFLTDCLSKGMAVYASSINIGTVAQSVTTWFKGYDDKYYYDRGALFAAMYSKFAYIMLILMEIHSLNRFKLANFFGRVVLQFKGAKDFLNK